MKLPLKYHDGKRVETIRASLRASARRYSSRPAIMQKLAGAYREISYAELLYKVEGLGTELLERGFYGKKIIIYGESCLEWATVFLAATCGLSVAVTVDKDIDSAELSMIAEKTEAAAIFYSSRLEENVASLNIKKFSFNSLEALIEEGAEKLACGNTSYLRLSIDEGDLAVISFGKNQSGGAKGIMLSQKNIAVNVNGLNEWENLYETDVNLAILPFHHAFGMTQIMLFLSDGMCNVFCEGLKIAKALVEYKVSVLVAVPLIFEKMRATVEKEIKKLGIEKTFNTGRKISSVLMFFGIDVRRKLFKKIIDKFQYGLANVAPAEYANPRLSRIS